MRKGIVLLSQLLLCLAASAQTTVRKFVLPVSGDGKAELTAFLPDPTVATGMAILDCPGGGYQMLAMQHEGTDWAPFFNGKGIAYFVLKYRLPNGDSAIPYSDATAAMRLIRDSAVAWHINPEAVGIMGFSAGGHLASTVATHAEYAERPNFQILFYPVITMQRYMTHEGSAQNILGAVRDSAAFINLYSNEKQVRAHLTPPALILLSDDDVTVNPAFNGVAYYQSLRQNSVKSAMHIYPSGGHGWGANMDFKYHAQMLQDLSSWLDTQSSKLHAQSSTLRVACVGNSITDGFGIDYKEVYGYPAQLQQLLGNGYKVKNYGVSGRTMLRKGDYPYMEEMAWRDCKAFQPDIVIIKLGTNDSKPQNWRYGKEYARDMQQMIDELQVLPSKPKIYLAMPVTAVRDMYDISEKVIANKIIPIIQKVAKKNHLPVIDLHTPIADMSLFIGDGIHPNAEGARKMAELIYNNIK